MHKRLVDYSNVRSSLRVLFRPNGALQNRYFQGVEEFATNRVHDYVQSLRCRLIEEFQERYRRSRTLHNLTEREKEVLELLDEGLGTAEIAGRLFVARVTVRTHVASILKKLGVPDREAAVRVVGRR